MAYFHFLISSNKKISGFSIPQMLSSCFGYLYNEYFLGTFKLKFVDCIDAVRQEFKKNVFYN